MVQSLAANPTWICVDSGAGESVCPVEAFPEFEAHETSKNGKKFMSFSFNPKEVQSAPKPVQAANAEFDEGDDIPF